MAQLQRAYYYSFYTKAMYIDIWLSTVKFALVIHVLILCYNILK